MKLSNSDRTVRRNIALRTRELDTLDTLRTRTALFSDSDIVRHSLLVLEDLVNRVRKQQSLFLVDKSGREKPFDVLAVDEPCDTNESELQQRNVNITDAAKDRLNELQETLGVPTTSHVVRHAIAVLDKLVSTMIEDGVLVSRNPADQGRETELLLPIEKRTSIHTPERPTRKQAGRPRQVANT
jgi:hypothetical protein